MSAMKGNTVQRSRALPLVVVAFAAIGLGHVAPFSRSAVVFWGAGLALVIAALAVAGTSEVPGTRPRWRWTSLVAIAAAAALIAAGLTSASVATNAFLTSGAIVLPVPTTQAHHRPGECH